MYKVVNAGGRVRQHTVYDHLPDDLVHSADVLAKKEGISRAGALYLVLSGSARPKCVTCGVKLPLKMWPRVHPIKDRHCSSLCAGADPAVEQRRQKTVQAIYGVSHVQKVNSVRAKFKATMLESHGVTYTGESSVLREKMKKTTRDRFGVDHATQAKEIQKKIRKTYRTRYGVDHPSKCRVVFERMQSAFHIKQFTLNGKQFSVRGSEPEAIRYLVKKGVSVKDIITTAKEGLPSVPYVHKGKKHVYHPDMLVTHKGKTAFIEVKSTYTAGIEKGQSGTTWARNRAKFKAVVSRGLEIYLLMVSKNKRSMKLIAHPETYTRPKLRKVLRLH